MHPNIYVINNDMDDQIFGWMILVSDSRCHIVDLECPKVSYKDQQMMLGVYLVLVTLHGQFTTTLNKNAYTKYQ